MKTLVVIDDREDYHHQFSKRLHVILKARGKSHEFRFHVKRLSLGDIAILTRSTTHILELKEANDFYQSLIDGRLFTQALRSKQETLMNHEIRGFTIIIYGSWKTVFERYALRNQEHITYDAWLDRIHSTILALLFRYHVTVWMVNDFHELTRFLVNLLLRESKGAGPMNQVKAVVPRLTDNSRVNVLSVIPNIGEHKAALLLQYFSTPLRVFLHPSPHKLVPGVGEKVSQSISQVITGQDSLLLHSFNAETQELHFTLRLASSTLTPSRHSIDKFLKAE